MCCLTQSSHQTETAREGAEVAKVAKVAKVATNTMEEGRNVDDLLSTLRIPVYPPDRSQWRKLELAMKFINNSKTSVKQTKERKESLKISPKDPELFARDHGQLQQNGHSSHSHSRTNHEVMVSTRPARKMSNWSKIRKSLQQIM